MDHVDPSIAATYQSLGIGPNRPIFPYEITSFLEALPGYDASEGKSELLDLSRAILESNDYIYMGIPFPVIMEGDLVNIAQGQTVVGSISVPAYSYLVSITAYFQSNEGFKLRVYDKGAQTDLFYNRYAKECSAAGVPLALDPANGDAASDVADIRGAIGPGLLQSPMIILPPGTLQVEATSLTSVAAGDLIQVLFNFAVPISNANNNAVSMVKG